VIALLEGGKSVKRGGRGSHSALTTMDGWMGKRYIKRSVSCKECKSSD